MPPFSFWRSMKVAKAQDLLSRARAARLTQPDLAIGYLVDIEPLIEQGALQKVVACECKRGEK
jgi:hypothetical protein